MKTGMNTRKYLFLFLLTVVTTGFTAGPTAYMQVRRLDTNQMITKPYVYLYVVEGQSVALEMTGYFDNDDTKPEYTCWLRRTPESAVFPSFIYGWEDQQTVLYPGEEAELSDIMYIWPAETGRYDLSVEVALRVENDGLIANRFTIHVIVDKSPYDLPEIFPEPTYTRGTSNDIRWKPAAGSLSQDVYAFDVNHPDALQKAMELLYKRPAITDASADTLQAHFQNLKHGSTYGYFVRSEFNGENGPVYLHSNMVFSTQDQLPPNPVIKPHAKLISGTKAVVSWKTVKDTTSGVLEYRIYRAEDTGREYLRHSVSASTIWADSASWTDALEPGKVYQYRIRAVDGAGNESDGDRTNGIHSSGSGAVIVTPGDPADQDNGNPANGIQYIAGCRDTLFFSLDGQEELVRFQAARDQMAFFDTPPGLPMRVFDSGWIPVESLPAKILPSNQRYWVFDYTGSGSVDANFVNGHVYHRRVIRKYFATTDTLQIGSVTSDCFPPDDISNLKVEAIIDDPDFDIPTEGYTRWHMEISWDASSDAVSGLKRYHVYRKIDGVDIAYKELDFPEDFTGTFFRDSLGRADFGAVANPMIRYRVVSEDYAGLRRTIYNTGWEDSERALEAPVFTLSGIDPAHDYMPDEDSLFTRKNHAIFKLSEFDITDVRHWLISIDGDEKFHPNLGRDTLKVLLTNQQGGDIYIQAHYLGRRASLWASPKVVIRTNNDAPTGLVVKNDSTQWHGHLYLEWIRPALDAQYYEIWRKDESGDSLKVGQYTSKKQVIQWTDYYDINELTGNSVTPLTAYAGYRYRVRKINMFGEISEFSGEAQNYCNRPPRITRHTVETVSAGTFAVSVFWERPFPNKVPSDYTTELKIYKNDLDHPVQTKIIGDDRKSYTFLNGEISNNYIFILKEIPNQLSEVESARSRPYTVTLDTIRMAVQEQPQGGVFIYWNDPVLVQKYRVSSYQLCRDDICFALPGGTVSYMDTDDLLVHGRRYAYTINALDSLGQIVGTNTKYAVVDTGSVFIPDIQTYGSLYFNHDSLHVSWVWYDINKQMIDNSTRGARILTIQTSISRTFPGNPSQTVTETFNADSQKRDRMMPIPSQGGRENDILYFRISARDNWGNPSETVWSTRFYSMKTAIFDTVPPPAVDDFRVAATEAYYLNHDSIYANLRWEARGVEIPDSAGQYWDRVIGNIAHYRIERADIDGMNWSEAGLVPASKAEAGYLFQDPIPNQRYAWRITAIDSAGNITLNKPDQLNVIINTPAPPVPTGYRSCAIEDGKSGPYSFFVEMAMYRDHFRFAYEINDAQTVDQILCQSGWIQEPVFTCASGWGKIKSDTTWFRLKAGSGVWESGWSHIVYYTEKDDAGKSDVSTTSGEELPRAFHVTGNYPNPFNMETAVAYELPESGTVTARIYNVRGEMVEQFNMGEQSPGRYQLRWNGKSRSGSDVASGIYMIHIEYQSQSGQFHMKQFKMTVIK